MRFAPSVVAGLAAAIVLSGALAASGAQASSPSVSRSAAEADDRRAAERLTVRVCSGCHAPEVINAERRTPGDWLRVVEEMAARSDATPVELGTIRDFLARTRGVVAVNTAPAVDFVAVLGLSSEAAQRVVAYREAHGRFTDRPALLKVAGLDTSRTEVDSAALLFE